MLPGAVNTFALIISSTPLSWLSRLPRTRIGKHPKAHSSSSFQTRKRVCQELSNCNTITRFNVHRLKLVEWSHLVAEGFTVGTVQGSIFYVATGAHGLHVFVGLLIMLYLVFKADTIGYDEDNGQGIEYFGLYWHFVDLAWVVIFPAFYLY